MIIIIKYYKKYKVCGSKYIRIGNIFIGMEWRFRNKWNKKFETADDGITYSDVENDLFESVWLSSNRNT